MSIIISEVGVYKRKKSHHHLLVFLLANRQRDESNGHSNAEPDAADKHHSGARPNSATTMSDRMILENAVPCPVGRQKSYWLQLTVRLSDGRQWSCVFGLEMIVAKHGRRGPPRTLRMVLFKSPRTPSSCPPCVRQRAPVDVREQNIEHCM